MERARYEAFTHDLEARVAGDDRVLGLVALGSTAVRDYEPDAWSDHDVYLIARPDAAEGLRDDLRWLPDPERIVLAFRETAHGAKVLYDDGHLVELAVFTPDELRASRSGRSRVLLDRGGVEEAVAATSVTGPPTEVDLRFELGMVVTNLLVGIGRHRRGERLSGHAFVAGHALGHLVRALTVLPSADAGLLDALDPRRRFERAHPHLGAELDGLLARPVPEMAEGMLDVAEQALGDRLPDDVLAAITVVRRVASTG